MRILLVEPEFPIPPKSKNHKNFLPLGLLKLHDYYKSRGHKPKLIRGNKSKRKIGTRFKPNQIMITSLFTYWSKYVWETVDFYREKYPDARIIIGGIYASLMRKTTEFKKNLRKYNAEVHRGVYEDAENYAKNNTLDYSALNNTSPIDYQIIHASRGCKSRCPFCGTWKIEPEFIPKKSIKDEIKFRKLVFYDNNFLMNPYIENILNELIELKKKRKILWCESQSGFDGRILLKNPHLAKMIKKAGFRYPRIAWDWGYNQSKSIKKQIDLLVKAGYNSKEIYVFMLYNWDILFEEMEGKRLKCWEWKVQISDCRYRPLDQTYDNYNPQLKEQPPEDYHIHEGWTDALVRQFRKNVRSQNICVRQDVEYYSSSMERKKISKEKIIKLKKLPYSEASKELDDAWNPAEIHYPDT